jgi:hypothetical protein
VPLVEPEWDRISQRSPFMPPKVHPADEAAARLIAGAQRFEIALFRGQGSYARARAASLDEARAAAARLEAEVGNGRPALIYALDAGGRSALVTPATIQATEMHDLQKTYGKKFNAQRAAERAGIAPDRIEVEKTPEGFVWREKLTATAPAPAPAPRAKGRRPAAAKPPTEPQRGRRTRYKELEAQARKGKLPNAPDFSAATHARFRNKLARLVELAAAGDIAGLKAVEINPVSSSPRAMMRYRDLCVMAIESRAEA